jgi:polyhydroxybutyrate depolymerase
VCAAALVALAVLAGCSGGPLRRDRDTAAGTTEHTLTVAGAARTYRLHRPAALDGAVPLVVMLHGGFGSARQAAEAYGWDAAADAEGFAVAYPDGVSRAWNAGAACCGEPGRDGVDDVAFVSAVVDDVAARLVIDRDRVYATGISNGGMMSYRLACDTDVFAAVAPVAATMLGDCPAPRPVSVLHVHGSADESVRLDGSAGTGAARIDGPPVAAVIAHWREAGGCAAPVTGRAGGVTTERSGCPAGREVTLVTVAGAGHQWPGSEPTRAQRALGADEPSTALDATAEIWRFFAAHPRGAAAGGQAVRPGGRRTRGRSAPA